MTCRNYLRPVGWICALIGVVMTFSVGTSIAKADQSRLERIQAEKRLRVCIWPDYHGISFRSPANQELRGLDIDLALELGREMQVSTQFIDSSFARLTEDVLNDRCDVAMFAVGVTAARAEKLRFTTPHLASDIYAVTTRNHPRISRWDDIDQPGVVVAVTKGTLHENVMRAKLRHARLLVLDSPHAREDAVESGQADVFMADYPYSMHMESDVSWARVIKPDASYNVTPYAWAVAPSDERWLQRLERFLATIKRDGRLLTAARRHGLEPIVVTR